MILKGSQRAGSRQMALHLLNTHDNEHVHVHQVRGFIAGDVAGALNEAYAMSQATKCRQFMYSLSLSPPSDQKVATETFEKTITRAEKMLGLEGQPRVVIFHEKEGRRHAHCVWSRIDGEELKAINIAFPKRKLMALSKAIYLENGWNLPAGFKDKSQKNPLNFTHEEWQQAARTSQHPKAIKAALQECWAVSDNKKSFASALEDKGYFLARGDKRGFVAMDVHGEVYSLSRHLNSKTKEISGKIGAPDTLPSVSEVKADITTRLSKLFTGYMEELKKDQAKQAVPLHRAKKEMTEKHRAQRKMQKDWQNQRWQGEQEKRASRIRHGFKGLWDKLNGKYWKIRKQNEQGTWDAHLRDLKQREKLIQKQLEERQNLQSHLNMMNTHHEQQRQELIRDLSQITKNKDLNAKPSPNLTNLKEIKPTPSKSPRQEKINDQGPEV